MSDAIMARLAACEARLAALESRGGSVSSGGGGEVADDDDLDSEHGDFVVKKDPYGWKGDSCEGCRLSECPSDYLLKLAGSLDSWAKKIEKDGKPYVSAAGKSTDAATSAQYKRRDAARARGWAKRNAGKVAKARGPASTDDAAAKGDSSVDEDEIPF